jgi:hypothetical protein
MYHTFHLLVAFSSSLSMTIEVNHKVKGRRERAIIGTFDHNSSGFFVCWERGAPSSRGVGSVFLRHFFPFPNPHLPSRLRNLKWNWFLVQFSFVSSSSSLSLKLQSPQPPIEQNDTSPPLGTIGSHSLELKPSTFTWLHPSAIPIAVKGLEGVGSSPLRNTDTGLTGCDVRIFVLRPLWVCFDGVAFAVPLF